MHENKIDEAWSEILKAASNKFTLAQESLSKLTPEEQEIVALAKLEMDLFNGGFIQFFCNWGFEAYKIALEALSHIGALTAKEYLVQCYAAIEKFKDMNVNHLWDLPKMLNQKDETDLKEAESLLIKVFSEVADKGLLYYKK